MGIIFLLTLLQILIWGEKVLTLCQKMHFFDKTTRFPLEIAKKKTFSIEISENNAHTLPFHVTWSVKTTQKLFRSFSTQNKRYSELLSVFDLLFQFEMKPSNSPLFSWDVFLCNFVKMRQEQENKLEQRVLQFFLILRNPPPPKVTKSTFYNISSSLLRLSFSKLFLYDKSIFALRNKNLFDGKPKMTEKFEFEKKIPNSDILPFWEIFNF